MIERYQYPEIEKIWNDQNKFDTWKLVEQKYLETLEESNISPSGIAEAVEQTEVLKDEVYKREKITNHDLASFVDVLQSKIGDNSNWIHYGLTSSDVVDTANSLLIKQSLSITIELLDELLIQIEAKAKQEMNTPIVGRTHGVFAETTFLGNIFGNWHQEIKRNKERLEEGIKTISIGKLSGPVGNHTVVDEDIEKTTLNKLGLEAEIFASQVVARDRYAEIITSLAILASSFERVATNIRGYQRSEISELSEPFKEGQKGSSAMPHKKNPIASERITGLARVVRGYALSSMENIVLWHERDISNSSVERIILPDTFNLICFMTKDLISIFDGLHINYKAIEKNLSHAADKLNSQKILSALVKNDIDRDEAYRSVQDLTFENFSTKEIVTKLSKKFKIDSSLIIDFIEEETSLSNDEESFNNKFK
ncbi:adenylosuccinate lyase [Acidimicrobiaceae bacterium]|nr:adenylosuccinate lyase [Acidimicrobiaceae bacterium]